MVSWNIEISEEYLEHLNIDYKYKNNFDWNIG